MSRLTDQVACLLNVYSPHVPRTGRVHRCLDDDEVQAKDEADRQCSKCHKWKPADEYWMRADGRRYGYCRICAAKQDRERAARRKAK